MGSVEDLRDAVKNPILVNDGEDMNDLLGLPPEELLKQWVNYHLEMQEYPDRITNFSGDVKDGKVYTVLLKSIGGGKGCTTEPLQWDTDRRAGQVLSSAQREPVGDYLIDDRVQHKHYAIRCMNVCLTYLILSFLL